MLDLLRSRLAQGTPTSAFPDDSPDFPPRFRGRPALSCNGCAGGACLPDPDTLATGFVRPAADGSRVLDLGACLFSPEEGVGTPECGVVFSRDHRLAGNSRDALVASDGEWALARALDARMCALFGRSLRLRSVAAGSCGGCEAELVALGNVVFDMARFGIQFVASPRHADGIVITGAVSVNMREALERTWAAVAEPRLVIAVGACAASGGPFRGSPEVAGVPPASIPVDLWIPGCPPHPVTMLDGLLRLLGRITTGTDRRPSGG